MIIKGVQIVVSFHLTSSHWYIFELKYPLMIVTEITDSTIHGLARNSLELIFTDVLRIGNDF